MARLLEREAELEALAAIVEATRAGAGAVAMILGEAGIGKTSLLRAARGQAGLAFHVGRCESLSVPEPLGPIRELAAAVGAGAMPELASDDRRALARALQMALTADGAAVAVIEDAHWADPATLDVVRLLARRVEEQPLGLIVTFRDDEVAANPPLGVLVGDLATDPTVRRIPLRPLSSNAVRALAQTAQLTADADDLVRMTGGNPFLVAELIAAGGAIPPSVRDATLARVARLRSGARGLVDIAAVVGQRVPFDLLAELAPESADAIDEALARGVLTDDGATLGFRHELTRQAIEQALSTPRRAALHGQVASALGQRARPDHARIAHHAEAAGLSELATRHAALAADEAEQVGALFEAGLQLDRALRLGGDCDRAIRIDLLVRYARCMNFAGRRLEDARKAAAEAASLADLSGDRRLAGRARTVLTATLWSLDRLEEARASSAEAVELLDTGDDAADLARAWAARVRIESIAFDPAVAIAEGERALAAADAADLQDARIDTSISLGLAHGHRGHPDALRMLDDARRQAIVGGSAIQIIRAHVNTAAVAGDARAGTAVDAVVAEALPRFAQINTAIARQYLRVMEARSLLDRGRYDEALDRAAESRGDWHGGLVIADAVTALIAARRGSPGSDPHRSRGPEGSQRPDPRAELETALASLDAVPPGWRHLLLSAALAEVAWLAGDLEAARAYARRGLAAPFAAQLVRPRSDALLWAARAGVPPAEEAADPPLPDPVRLELDGHWRAAIDAWRSLDAPYEAAMAALPGDEKAARDAVAALHRLGADAAARAFARERAARGATALRGPRRSTLANVAGLTRREQEILVVLASGKTNPQIAAELHLSERTVAHHVSAILGKLSAPTRAAAIDAARRAGLLEDGPL